MNGVIVLFAVLAMSLIAMWVIVALKQRTANDAAARSGGQDESVLLI
jgi:hypothetical protein